MRKRKTAIAPTVPLAERIRAALAQGWHTLAALDDLTGLRGSKARAAVHEALREVTKSGATVEESMVPGGVAVRIVEVAEQKDRDHATRDSDGDRPGGSVCVGDEAAAREAVANEPGLPGAGAHPVATQGDAPQAVGIALGSATSQGVVVSETDQADAPPAKRKQCPSVWHGIRCEREEGHPCNDDGHHETKDRSIAIWTTDAADRWAAGEAERKAAAEPGPSSHCAVCEVVYAQHGADRGHPFAPKPRGRPRAKPIPNAAPAILPQAKQRKAPGPIVDVDGRRVERAGDAEPALQRRKNAL